MAFEHIPPSSDARTQAFVRSLETFFGELIDERVEELTKELEAVKGGNRRLADELRSKQSAFDEAQSRYESLYRTHSRCKDQSFLVSALRNLVDRTVNGSALAIWRDNFGFAASGCGWSGITGGPTLTDALHSLDMVSAQHALNGCPPVTEPELSSDLALFGKFDMRGLAKLQRRWVTSMPWRDKTPLEGLALIASEIGEAVNECRGERHTPELGAELADIVLRTLDLAEMLEIDIEDECRRKMAHNIDKGNFKGRGV